MSVKSVDEYLNLPYSIKVICDQGEGFSGWFAEVMELPGCMTQTERFEDLEWMIQDAMRGWIETTLEAGRPVPEPRFKEE